MYQKVEPNAQLNWSLNDWKNLIGKKMILAIADKTYHSVLVACESKNDLYFVSVDDIEEYQKFKTPI